MKIGCLYEVVNNDTEFNKVQFYKFAERPNDEQHYINNKIIFHVESGSYVVLIRMDKQHIRVQVLTKYGLGWLLPIYLKKV